MLFRSLRRMRMDFESGAFVVAPPATIGQQVQVDSLEDGRTRVEIQDWLKEIGGKR